MITVELQTEIEAPPETVFDLLADHTQFPLWDPHMIECKLFTEGPIVKGSKGITIGEFRGRRIETEIYYDTYDRPKYVSGGTSSGPVKAKNTSEFSPTENGALINWVMDVEFKGFMRLLEPFMKSSLIKQRQETMDALNDYIIKNR
ncbi:SRPBCC family protein [Chloroflexota bacterium]